MTKLTRFTEELASYGDYQKLHDINVVIDNILKSLSIQKGSYIADPEVGSNLFNYEFDIFDEETIENVSQEIKSTLTTIDDVQLENLKFEITQDRKGLVCIMILNILGNFSRKITIIITQEYIDLLSIEEQY